MVPSQEADVRYPIRQQQLRVQPTTAAAAAAVEKKKHMAASQPVDADDLRRRLFIVISEQNAAEEKKRTARAQAAAAAAKVAAVIKRPDSPPTMPPPLHLKEKSKSTTPPMYDITHWATQIVAALDHTSEFSAQMSKSESPKSETPEYKLHHGRSTTPSSAGDVTPGIANNLMCMYIKSPQPAATRPKSGNAYVPTQAAAQFVATATTDNMMDKNGHRFSMRRQSSIPEGFNLMRKRAMTLDSSESGKPVRPPSGADKEKRRDTLRPASKGSHHSQQESPSNNPFKLASPEGKSQRSSYRNSTLPARRQQRDLEALDESVSPGDRTTSVQFEESALPPEPRTDWTQADEAEKKKGMQNPFRRDSKWGFRDRKPSRLTGIDSGVGTTVSTDAVNSPRSPPKGFLSRFRKQSTTATS